MRVFLRPCLGLLLKPTGEIHMATKEQLAQDAAEYADQFGQDTPQKPEMSDDEAMGIYPEEAPATEEASQEEGAAEALPAAEAAPVEAVEEAAPAADDPAKAEQKLKSWEGRLKAKEAELNSREKDLDAREASMSTSSVDATQSDSASAEEAGESAQMESGEQNDAAKILAEDFGADFVEHITSLIKSVAGGGVSGDNHLEATVSALIHELREEKQSNHFKSIAAAHEDFNEIAESPEFGAWKDSQPDAEDINRIVESGSADEIIAMLTKFKSSKEISNDGMSDEDSYAIDDAEGVRSSGGGLKLPDAPADMDDYEKAWKNA
jgi:hypothetical protein